MTTTLVQFPNLLKGLVIPDASAEMPPGSLCIATNVDLTKSGTIKQRPGTRLTTTGGAGTFQYAFVHQMEPYPVYVSTSQTYAAADIYHAGSTSLVYDATAISAPKDIHSTVQMLSSAMDTSDPPTYTASPSVGLRRFYGSSFDPSYAPVSGSPKCRYVAQAGWTERLFYGGFTAGATNGPNGTPVDASVVGVSDVSEPEVFTTTSTVSLTPGDGEEIKAIISWASQTFVFKETKFFVFYDELDSGGAVELLFHERTGTGCVAPGCVAAGPDGVYFLAADGVYRTTGGTAVCVSDQIAGLFTGELPSWTPYARNLPSPDTPAPKMACIADKVYCAVGTASDGISSTAVLVYDITLQAWTYYDIEVTSLLTMPWPNMASPLLIGVQQATPGSVGAFKSATFHPSVQSDNGAFVPVEFQLHWFQAPNAKGYVGMDQAAILRLEAFGAGIYNVAALTDFGAQPGRAKEMDFGDMSLLGDDVWAGAVDEWGDGTGTSDEWGDGTGTDVWGYVSASEVWGDGTDPDDVWGEDYQTSTDLLRLQPPRQRFVYNLRGRGNYLTARFTKTTAATYCYLSAPKITLQSR